MSAADEAHIVSAAFGMRNSKCNRTNLLIVLMPVWN